MFGGGLGTQRFIACGGPRLTVSEVLSLFEGVESSHAFFPTKNEFSLKIPQMLVSRVVFAESEWALLSVLWRKLYCIWFSFYIKYIEKSVFDMVEKYDNVLLFFLHRYFNVI